VNEVEVEHRGQVGYPHLFLRDWPFRIVPSRESAKVWADREVVREQVLNLLNQLSRRSISSLHLMWADFGAGKTHTLLHMCNLCESRVFETLLPVYVEWPKSTKTFLDVYRAASLAFSERLLPELLYAALVRNSIATILGTVRRQHPGMAVVLEALQAGIANALPVAMRWLRADPTLYKRELRVLGPLERIESSDEAVRVLGALVSLLVMSGTYRRLLLMVDEFQRMGTLRPRVREEVNSGLHTLVNTCPDGLTLLLSFSFGRPENIKYLISNELRSRADLEMISLPVFSRKEAHRFTVDLLDAHRIEGAPSHLYPFTEQAIRAILARTGTLIPREIIKRLDMVLRRAEIAIHAGQIQAISRSFAEEVLADAKMLLEEES